MTRLLIGAWGIVVVALYFLLYFSSAAASFEPIGRYLYMAALCASTIAVALGLMRARQTTEE